MLKRKKQHKYLVKRWRAIRRYLHDFANGADLEVLHKLRVEVKKLKAFAGFAAAGGRSAAAAIKPVKKMFREAGVIREAGLTLTILQKYQLTQPRLKSATVCKLNEAIAAFQAHTGANARKVKKSDKKLRAGLRDIRNRDIKNWFSQQLTATAALLAVPPPGRLHDARKLLKNLLYSHAMLPRRLAADIPLNKTYLHRLQELIGNWHDVALAADLLAGKTKQLRTKSRLTDKQQSLVKQTQATAKKFMEKASMPETAPR